MREFWIIFKQSFMTKAKTKSFFITTLIMVAGIFLFANLPSIIDKAGELIGDGKEDKVLVLDQSGMLAERLQQQLKQSDEEIKVELADRPKEQLLQQVKDEDIEAFIELDLDAAQTIQATYTTASLVDNYLPSALQDALQSIQTEVKAAQLSLSGEQVATLFAPIQFEKQNISDTAKSEDELNQARVLVYVLMFVIYFAVIIYSSMIATEVATEKSSRVMEILISSVSPVKHMFAKVLGIGSLGIVQILVYGVAGFIAYKLSSMGEENELSAFFSLENLQVSTLVYAVIFFLLGYFLYATLAALLGSLVSRTEDVQQMIMPMSLLVVAAFIIAATGLGNPELGYLKIASFIPFFTPLVMFLRVGMLDLPLWEPLLSIAIMVATIIVLGWFGAKVYRGGVLMYGPSRSLKDLKKAIQLGKE
ncbi:ABC superfamily ATP binding cassette transporter, membrane protein [Sporosarcina newyorkensis 2681]|uniref:ABC superfamily ATP binding cassette transporter, membrane protein n=1 Tax=Sporosarcina newyorkensis 2681 TaxID=1027292 RepID=F9DXS4_9BACL|nr:ABC transporter permease [Sporosarcina newyorkensis]EGQ20062.1 ABC superfamily ATP binding cassette transporter, membrane protein [Sporosarcina newyorkensis 2681]